MKGPDCDSFSSFCKSGKPGDCSAAAAFSEIRRQIKTVPTSRRPVGPSIFSIVSSLGLIAPKLLLVGHNLYVVLGQYSIEGIAAEYAYLQAASSNGQSIPVANLDLLDIVFGAAGGACLAVAGILVLLDLQIVLCGDLFGIVVEDPNWPVPPKPIALALSFPTSIES